MTLALGAALAATTFVFDLWMPLGVAAAVPYAGLVLLSLQSPRVGPTWIAALSASGLTLLGMALSAPTDEPWKALINRSLALFVIWMTAVLCLGQKRRDALAEQNRKALTHAEQMSGLGEMAAGIAHELGNPLAALQGRVEMLGRKLAANPVSLDEVRQQAESIEHLSLRMIRILHGMRSLSRDASGDPVGDAALAEVVRDAVDFSRPGLRRRGIELETGPLDDALKAPCRETQIGQILVNLIRNGADAVDGLPEAWVRVDLAADSAFAEISVTDSGDGVPEALRERVMEPFFSTKAGGRGTGLGLHISRTIAEQHGGSLELDTDSPRTRFVLRLPRSGGSG